MSEKAAKKILHLVLLLVSLGAILLIVLLTAPAPAKADEQETAPTPTIEMTCGDHANFVRQLTERYEEGRIWLGLVKDERNVLEVFVSPSGTWSLLVTYSQGENRTCLVAEGKTWQSFPLSGTPPGSLL